MHIGTNIDCNLQIFFTPVVVFLRLPICLYIYPLAVLVSVVTTRLGSIVLDGNGCPSCLVLC